jgi:hypothetical protein
MTKIMIRVIVSSEGIIKDLKENEDFFFEKIT